MSRQLRREARGPGGASGGWDGPGWRACLSLVVLAASCARAPPVSFGQAELTAFARLGDPAPVASLELRFDRPLSRLPWLEVNATRVGVEALQLVPRDLDGEAVQVTFRAPSSLGPGVYADTLEVSVCGEPACATHLPDGTRSLPVRYTVSEVPAPVLAPVAASLSPRWARAGGGPEVALEVTGRGFVASSLVLWNGAALPTFFRSHSTLLARVPASAVAGDGVATVAVSNAWTDGGVSAPLEFLTFASGTPPRLEALSPSGTLADQADLTLLASGRGFDPDASLTWNGVPLATRALPGDQLGAVVPAELVRDPGTAMVAVLNGPGSGGASTPLALVVAPLPPPRLEALTPARVLVGGPALILTLDGQSFGRSSVVWWNGTPVPTTFHASTQLSIEVGREELALAGPREVRVHTRDAGSATLSFQVERGPQDAVSVQVDPAHRGAIRFNALRLPGAASWTADLGGRPGYPLIAEGKAFVTVGRGASSELVALDLATGARVWGPVELPGVANAAYEAGQVFVFVAAPGQRATVRAYAADSGAAGWVAPLEVLEAFPFGLTALGGRVYPGTDGAYRQLHALRAGDGTEAWHTPLYAATSAPAVTPTALYLTVGCSSMSLNPVDGGLVQRPGLTKTSCPSLTTIPAWPTVAEGAVLTYSWLWGPQLWSADPVWFYSLGWNESYGLGPPATASGAVVFLASDRLYSYTPGLEQQRWSAPVDAPGPVPPPSATPPLVINQDLFIAVGTRLLVHDVATGAPLATLPLDSPAVTPFGANDGWTAASGMAAGAGMLLVPNGTSLTAFLLSTDP